MWYHITIGHDSTREDTIGNMARKKGHGRLFLRNGVWYMRWRYCGRECTRTTGISNDRPDAKERAAKALEEATEILRLRDRVSRIEVLKSMMQSAEEELKDRLAGIRRDRTLDELGDLFRESAYRIDCSAEQLATYGRYIDALRQSMGGGLRIADVDARLADLFARRLAEGRSPNTYNKYLNGLSVVWRAVSPSVGITANPWDALPRKKLDTNVRRALTDDEIERVFAKAEGETRTLFAVGLYTGLRLGDAVRLAWEDIRDGAVFVTTGKTGAKVGIPLHPRLAEVLGERGDRSGLVMPTLARDYAHGSRSLVPQKMSRLFRACGITTSRKVAGSGMARPDCGFHSLRHTFVSRCAAAGVPQSIVQALVGHSSARMTEHYTHLSDKAFLAAFSNIR